MPKTKSQAQKNRDRKQRAYKKQGNKCYYCNLELPINNVEWEHLKARSQKGRSALFNLVLACKPCNKLKDSICTIVEAEAYVHDLMHFWANVERNNLLPRNLIDYPKFYEQRK